MSSCLMCECPEHCVYVTQSTLLHIFVLSLSPYVHLLRWQIWLYLFWGPWISRENAIYAVSNSIVRHDRLGCSFADNIVLSPLSHLKTVDLSHSFEHIRFSSVVQRNRTKPVQNSALFEPSVLWLWRMFVIVLSDFFLDVLYASRFCLKSKELVFFIVVWRHRYVACSDCS